MCGQVGARFFRVIQAAYEVAALGVRGDAAGSYNTTGIIQAATRYNASFASYTGYLLSCATCGTRKYYTCVRSKQAYFRPILTEYVDAS